MESLIQALGRPDIQAAIIGALATVVVGTVGALMVVVQIGEQARGALAQNRDNEAVKLKLRVYEEVAEICRRAVHAEVELSGFVRNFLSNVRLIQGWQSQGVPWRPPRERFQSYQDLVRAFDDATSDAVFAIERWMIIDPRVDLFRDAIGAAKHDIMECSGKYVPIAIRAMPMPLPDDGSGQERLFPWTLPNVERLTEASEPYVEALGECGAYLGDLQVAMQNLLLGDLFNNRLEAREPLDPRLIAVRLDRYDELKPHFRMNTAWGLRAEQTIFEVKEALAQRDSPT